jgi:hypothetical protein
MKRFVAILFCSGMLFWLVGCTIETVTPPPAMRSPPDHPVINEVFTLPPDDLNAHSWLEIFNPTSRTIDISSWTLSFRTNRYQVFSGVFEGIKTDSAGHKYLYDSSFVQGFKRLDDYKTYDSIPIVPAGRRVRLQPNSFYTLVSDLSKLRVFTNVGPGNGPDPVSTPVLERYIRFGRISRDTLNPRLAEPDTLFSIQYDFLIPEDSCQIVLKDSVGDVVDVIRFGNYAYRGPGAEPFPANISLGPLPFGQSFARYAGAYFTGNSSTDFYFTDATNKPIPQWFSQRYK